MTNLNAFSIATRNWLKPIVKQVGGNIRIPALGGLGKMATQYLGIDLSTYNVLNELDFLIDPTLDNLLQPTLTKWFKNLPDEAIPQVVNSYIDAAIKKAQDSGKVNVFGLEMSEQAFVKLKDLFNDELNKEKL